jgi:hypothetical protein
MTLADLAIVALAACYWAFVIPKKSGPWGAFDKLRARTTIGGLLLCPPCLVFWIAVLMWLAWQTPLAPIVSISAIAGGATFLGYYGGMWMQ